MPVSVTNNDAALTAAVAGFGIARSLSYQTDQLVAEGKLKLLLEKFEPLVSPVNIIHREGREVSAKLRAFIDVMEERLRHKSSLNP